MARAVSNYLVGVHRGIYPPRWTPGETYTHETRTADDVYDRPFNPVPPRSSFGVRNEFAQSNHLETSQYRKDRQTKKDEFPIIDLNRIARKVVDKVEEMYASNMIANMKNSGQFPQNYFPPLGQIFASYAPGTGYNKERERPDIFGGKKKFVKTAYS
jgi:hypothetical protein